MTGSSPAQRRTSALVTLAFALAVLLPSLWGFSGKFIEFIALFRGDVDGVFAISPIVNYLLASLGFFCLFGWAVMHGMFSDIEQPKRTFLETEEMLDRLTAQRAPVTSRDLGDTPPSPPGRGPG